MKRFLALLTIGLSFLPFVTSGAQTAQGRFVCMSLRFQRSTANDTIGTRWTMDMTTLNAGINGEVAPEFFSGGYSNGAYVELYSELIDNTFTGGIVLDTPDFTDANDNGFADFFEVSQPVPPLTAVGAYNIASFGSGSFTATWSRDAGSAFGFCVYTISNPFGGSLMFIQQFELIEYVGPLSYTPSSNTVPVTLSLTNTNTLVTLEGPAEFLKSSTNRFNQLTFQNAFLTNNSLQVLDLFSSTIFLRSTGHRTNYLGKVDFNDGDPNTFEEDYYTWMLSIDDLNDSDNDGIPDFSDDPQTVTPPRRPQLSLARGPTNVLLSISGDVGRLHRILETSDLVTGNWLTNSSFTLTNDPQVVSLPLLPNGSKFWRVQAQ